MAIESNPVTKPWVPQDGGSIPVLAAVITRSDQWLLCKRPADKRHGGLWEFPGGKLHAGESLADAARRELLEELAVEVVSVGPVIFQTGDPGSRFEIIFVAVTIDGEPVPVEHDTIEWLAFDSIASLRLAPSDQEFVNRILTPGEDPST